MQEHVICLREKTHYTANTAALSFIHHITSAVHTQDFSFIVKNYIGIARQAELSL